MSNFKILKTELKIVATFMNAAAEMFGSQNPKIKQFIKNNSIHEFECIIPYSSKCHATKKGCLICIS